ncbi:MAG TPA: TIR domain-containing protein, partial [Xanthomonadales bacterium]|nr:TIR domain-containing protein [Xanthomonadales bacterium]
MADLLYRAFISYSHADEAWAEWLHHQLESYRVPKHLVGREGEHGVVPARLVPVFRDRDELSTGNNLTGKILTALEQSEAMIVLCSPASAASRWVNEEIRQFRALGRENRIFCVLVDGDSKASITPSNALPPALFESATDQQFEPLAADPRKWADGKYLAKLKLIAGLLGVRLDELRQRDLKRRRKWQAVTGLAVIAALTLTAVAVISTISQRHEREKAEQLATFIVDLGERMQSDVDLETMGVISQEAARHLGGLDLEKLSLETRIRVGLVFRQLAHVSEGQGRPDEALEAYTRSRDMFRELQKKYPQDQKVLFELGQAEFYVGNLFFQQGDYDAARAPLESYLQASQELLETDADKPEWIMELSYSITGLVALQIESGQGVDDKLLENVDKAVSLMETAMAQTPEDHTIVDHYATTLAWAADAQLEACNLEDAEISRRKVFALTESVSSADPSNNELKMGKAYALTGLANVL